MKAKLLLILAFIFIVIAVGIKTTSQNLSQAGRQLKELEEKEKRDSLTIPEQVELAKIKAGHCTGVCLTSANSSQAEYP